MSIRFLLAAASIAALSVSSAQAALTITSKPTSNVDCSGGTCTATAKHANLNADDLVTLLDAGDVTVASGHKAKDIEVNVVGGFQWNSAHRLTLDSFRSITFDRVLYYKGVGGGVVLTTNDGGTGGALNFGDKGVVSFIDVNNSTLVIDGQAYTLVTTISSLAGAVFANPSGHIAIARKIDAEVDGVHAQDPVTTVFLGRLEGLGNTIRHLKINNKDQGVEVGLFYALDGATVSNLHLAGFTRGSKASSIGLLAGLCQGTVIHVDVEADNTGAQNSTVGGACGTVDGNLIDVHASGSVTGLGDNGSAGTAGGLAGAVLGGTISQSSSSANVAGAKGWTAGGLVGHNQGAVQTSFATGAAVVGDDGVSGGLVGSNAGVSIANCYATGATQGGVNSTVGGMLGTNDGAVNTSYSTGPVASGSGNAVGGFVGNDVGSPDLVDDYWDIDTSGQSHGAGNNTADPGITGLTTAEFQAGLPSGFDPAVWAEDPGINGGLPYLIGNPPQ